MTSLNVKFNIYYAHLVHMASLVVPYCLVRSVLLICFVFCVVLFPLFVFVLCLVYPMFPVSIDCLILIAPSVFSNVSLLFHAYLVYMISLVH